MLPPVRDTARAGKTGQRWFYGKEIEQDNIPVADIAPELQSLLQNSSIALVVLERNESSGMVDSVSYWQKDDNDDQAPVRKTVGYRPGVLFDEII